MSPNEINPELLSEIMGNALLWVETFIRDFKDGAPFRPNKFQREILQSNYRNNVMRIHRRGGKTTAMILLCLYHCLTRENGRILFVAPRMSQVEAFFDELDKFIEFHPWIKASLKRTSKRPHVKVFSNGTTLKGFTTGASSKGNGTGLRGQGADVILLDEVAFMSDDDFAAVKPIIEGDAYQLVPAVTYAASTPALAEGVFYKWCKAPDSKFHEIVLPITENPDWSPEEIENIKKGCTVREWDAEYMVEFLTSGGTPFPAEIVDRNRKPFTYAVTPMPEARPEVTGGKPVKKVWRTMGVDWDKYNRDGSGPNIAVIECCNFDYILNNGTKEGLFVPAGTIRVIYRDHIKQSEYSLLNAVNRVEQLNREMNPDLIYVDAGMGETNVEELHQRGERNPSSRLKQKVKRIHFGSVIETEDPMGGLLKKPFKPFMVNLLGRIFESEQLWFPETDKWFNEQLIGYKIIHESANSVTYSKENEHIIDAVGLAVVAMWKIHKSPFKRSAATKGYLVPAPQVISSSELDASDLRSLKPIQQVILGAKIDNKPEVIKHPIGQGAISNGLPSLDQDSIREKPKIYQDAYRMLSAKRNLDRRLSSYNLRPPSSRSKF